MSTNKDMLDYYAERCLKGDGNKHAEVNILELCRPCGLRSLPKHTLLILQVDGNEIIARIQEVRNANL